MTRTDDATLPRGERSAERSMTVEPAMVALLRELVAAADGPDADRAAWLLVGAVEELLAEHDRRANPRKPRA